MSKNYCRITVKPDAIVVQSPYSDQMVAGLKRIPVKDRSWDEDERAWTIAERHLEDVQELAMNCFENVFLVEGDLTTELHSGRQTRVRRLF